MRMDDAMRQLFEKAERENLWFYSPYQQLWFSPAELKRAQRKGQFRWSSSNWQLRSPYAFIEEKRICMENASKNYELALARVAKEVKA